MSRVKDAFVTDQEQEDGFSLDPEYENLGKSALDDESYKAAVARRRELMRDRDIGLNAWTATRSTSEYLYDKIAGALANAQGELVNVEKKHEGYGGRYKFADLGQVLDIVRPVFSKHGLAFTQLVGDAPHGQVSVTTMLLHESGQTLQTTSSMAIEERAGMSKAQAAGAVITYLRRYQITAMAGIAQEDTDGAIEEKPKRQARAPKHKTQTETFQKPVPNPDIVRALIACEDVPTLKEMWSKLDKSEHKLYEGVKNQRKEELEKLATVDGDVPQ